MWCYICRDGVQRGEENVVECGACPKRFHLECLQQEGLLQPQQQQCGLSRSSGGGVVIQGEWLCPQCEEEQEDDEMQNDERCFICKKKEADSEDRLLLCDGCPNSYHMRSCLKMTIEPDEEKWFCPECNPAAFKRDEVRRLGRRGAPGVGGIRGAALEGYGSGGNAAGPAECIVNASSCYVCQRPGKLLGCDFCPNSFHPACLVDVDWNSIGEEWECPVCRGQDPLANQMHKRWTRAEIEVKRKERSKCLLRIRAKTVRATRYPSGRKIEGVPLREGIELKPHQEEGVEWLLCSFMTGGGILADEMGLGKTIQTLCFLSYLNAMKLEGPHLIVVPLSTVGNWMREVHRFTPSLTHIKICGSRAERQHALDDRYEAHRIKNASGGIRHALDRVVGNMRLLLTGTPLQNSAAELFTLINFLMPDVFRDSQLIEQAFLTAQQQQQLIASGQALQPHTTSSQQQHYGGGRGGGGAGRGGGGGAAAAAGSSGGSGSVALPGASAANGGCAATSGSSSSSAGASTSGGVSFGGSGGGVAGGTNGSGGGAAAGGTGATGGLEVEQLFRQEDLEKIRNMLDRVMLRRLKEQAIALPKKTFHSVWLPLSGTAAKWYERLLRIRALQEASKERLHESSYRKMLGLVIKMRIIWGGIFCLVTVCVDTQREYDNHRREAATYKFYKQHEERVKEAIAAGRKPPRRPKRVELPGLAAFQLLLQKGDPRLAGVKAAADPMYLEESMYAAELVMPVLSERPTAAAAAQVGEEDEEERKQQQAGGDGREGRAAGVASGGAERDAAGAAAEGSQTLQQKRECTSDVKQDTGRSRKSPFLSGGVAAGPGTWGHCPPGRSSSVKLEHEGGGKQQMKLQIGAAGGGITLLREKRGLDKAPIHADQQSSGSGAATAAAEAKGTAATAAEAARAAALAIDEEEEEQLPRSLFSTKKKRGVIIIDEDEREKSISLEALDAAAPAASAAAAHHSTSASALPAGAPAAADTAARADEEGEEQQLCGVKKEEAQQQAAAVAAAMKQEKQQSEEAGGKSTHVVKTGKQETGSQAAKREEGDTGEGQGGQQQQQQDDGRAEKTERNEEEEMSHTEGARVGDSSSSRGRTQEELSSSTAAASPAAPVYHPLQEGGGNAAAASTGSTTSGGGSGGAAAAAASASGVQQQKGKFEIDRSQPRLQRLLVFTQFQLVLDELESYCHFRGWKYLRLDGSTNKFVRELDIRDFNSENSTYFVYLISTRAGGLGINLTAANHVVLYDHDWNPFIDLQAVDRAHRIGQQREVHVWSLVNEWTVEERMAFRRDQKLRLDKLLVQHQQEESLDVDDEEKQQNRGEKISTDEIRRLMLHGRKAIMEVAAKRPIEIFDCSLEELASRQRLRLPELGSGAVAGSAAAGAGGEQGDAAVGHETGEGVPRGDGEEEEEDGDSREETEDQELTSQCGNMLIHCARCPTSFCYDCFPPDYCRYNVGEEYYSQLRQRGMNVTPQNWILLLCSRCKAVEEQQTRRRLTKEEKEQEKQQQKELRQQQKELHEGLETKGRGGGGSSRDSTAGGGASGGGGEGGAGGGRHRAEEERRFFENKHKVDAIEAEQEDELRQAYQKLFPAAFTEELHKRVHAAKAAQKMNREASLAMQAQAAAAALAEGRKAAQEAASSLEDQQQKLHAAVAAAQQAAANAKKAQQQKRPVNQLVNMKLPAASLGLCDNCRLPCHGVKDYPGACCFPPEVVSKFFVRNCAGTGSALLPLKDAAAASAGEPSQQQERQQAADQKGDGEGGGTSLEDPQQGSSVSGAKDTSAATDSPPTCNGAQGSTNATAAADGDPAKKMLTAVAAAASGGPLSPALKSLLASAEAAGGTSISAAAAAELAAAGIDCVKVVHKQVCGCCGECRTGKRSHLRKHCLSLSEEDKAKVRT
ncbi:UNVERIFIED_CONTAM: hypothetical protein H355_012869 [Colinus virginianus]|nr:hypothetical protein H355_012869 [Colinus virginianus]